MTTEHDPAGDAETRLAKRSREVFDDAVANLDGATRSRLNQARQAALQAAQGHPHSTRRWLIPAGSAAALVLATVVVVQLTQNSSQQVAGNADLSVARANAVDDLEIVTADADIDLLKDMDFYAWLDTQDMNAHTESGEG
jgi:hypothetical protein